MRAWPGYEIIEGLFGMLFGFEFSLTLDLGICTSLLEMLGGRLRFKKASGSEFEIWHVTGIGRANFGKED